MHRHHYTRLLPAAIEDGDWRLACSCGPASGPGPDAPWPLLLPSRQGHRTPHRARHGPRKVGEYGDAIDLIGRTWAWQSKATRAPLPRWVSKLDDWAAIEAHRWITDPIDHMEPIRRDLRPLLIRSWIRPGVRPVDIIIVRVVDWAEEHGCPVPMGEYMAMTGAHFLDCHGRDEA